MAMRPARGGRRRPTTPSRPWVGVQPVYQDFRPRSEWKEDGESDILLIYLPGFIRQLVKVSTEGTKVVRAKGERQDAGNKWSRFQEDYPVPERGNITAVRATFERGILTITIPWKEQTRESSKQATVVPVIPPNEVPPKTSSSPDAQKQSMIPLTELKESTVPPKSRDEQKDRLADPSNITIINHKERSVKGGETKGKSTKLESLEISKGGAGTDDKMPEKKSKELAGQTSAENAARENIGKEEMEKQATTTTTIITDNGLRTYKQLLKIFVEMNDERQLLANVGVAVLVIVALGIYIFTYTIPSGESN